jgi:broad-specificity NMP kinase
MGEGRVPFLLVSGPPGSGKTAVTWQVFSRLARLDVPHGIADLDLLGACWPRTADDSFHERLSARNLGAVWQNFKRQGAGRLVAAGVVESREQLDLYRDAVPGCDIVLCRLRAGPDVLRARILGRGREVGADADALSRRAVELSEKLEHAAIDDFVVDTDGRTLAEVAELVLAGCGWIAGQIEWHTDQ